MRVAQHSQSKVPAGPASTSQTRQPKRKPPPKAVPGGNLGTSQSIRTARPLENLESHKASCLGNRSVAWKPRQGRITTTLPLWPHTHQHSIFVGSVDDDLVIEDLHFDLFHPQGQRSVPILVLGCDGECRESVRPLRPWPGYRGAQDQRTAALVVKRVAIKRQVVSIARDDTGGVSADMAVVETILLQAVLVVLAGDVLAVHAVVGAIAVAEEVAGDVHPKGLVGGQLAPLEIAATLATGNTACATEGEALVALAALCAGVRADGACRQGLTGLHAAHALLEVTVLWTGESCRADKCGA